MSNLDSIVDVQISFDAQPISQLGFGTLMILGAHKRFNEKIKFYNSADEVLEDFDAADAEAIAATLGFSQDPRPNVIAIGRRDVDNVVITVDEAEESFEYVVTVNGQDFTYQAQAADDETDIAAGLVLAINGGAEPVTASDNSDGTFDIDADVAGAAYTLSTGDKLSVADLAPSDLVANDLTAIENASNDWYGLALISRENQDQQDAAAWIEARTKLFMAASDDSDVLDGASETDIAFVASAADYDRTIVIYHAGAANTYIDVAFMATQLARDPGSSTWNAVTLSGVSASNVNTTEANAAFDKSANLYITIADRNITRKGTVASGRFIDSMRGRDWLIRRIQEAVFNLLANQPKIPYTDNGLSSIENTIATVIDNAIDVGYLTENPAPEIVMPRVADVDPIDRGNRFLPGVEVNVTEAGAVHSIRIRGTLSV